MEQVNKTLEQYLKCTINYVEDDWTFYLLLIEITYNNIIYASTN